VQQYQRGGTDGPFSTEKSNASRPFPGPVFWTPSPRNITFATSRPAVSAVSTARVRSDRGCRWKLYPAQAVTLPSVIRCHRSSAVALSQLHGTRRQRRIHIQASNSTSRCNCRWGGAEGRGMPGCLHPHAERGCHASCSRPQKLDHEALMMEQRGFGTSPPGPCIVNGRGSHGCSPTQQILDCSLCGGWSGGKPPATLY
jgi:hypothetical protein